jgi:hypothetical protein
MVEEGLAIVKGISDRYDGVRRNPWNQIEWGNHYSRALASYSVLLALSGFRYSAVTKTAAFQPRMNEAKFAVFFAAGTGWGLYREERSAGSLRASLACHHGEITLRRLVLKEQAKLGPDVALNVTIPGGRTFECSATNDPGGIRAEFPEDIVLREGESLALRATAKPSGKASP